MKRWVVAVCAVFCLGVSAAEGPVVTVFSRDIHLSPDCRMIARPSVTGNQVYYSCSEISVRFMKAEKIDIEYLKNQDLIEDVTREYINKKEHYLIETRYDDSPSYIYIVCDDELCMTVHSINIEAIKSVVLQVGSKLLHKNV